MDDRKDGKPGQIESQKQTLQALVDLRDELLNLNARLEYLRLLLRLQQLRG